MGNAARTSATNAVLVATTTYFASLHTTTPGTTGAHEFTGGSYVRKAFKVGTATSGLAKNLAQIQWTGLPAKTGKYIGVWSLVATGTFKWAGHLKKTGTTHTFVFTTGSTFTIAATGLTATIA